MPDLMGGFDIGRSMQQYQQVQQLVDEIKKRRAARENPLATSLEEVSRAQEITGQEKGLEPQLLHQLLQSDVRMTPQGRQAAEQYYTGFKGRAYQARKRDFLTHMSTVLENFASIKNENASRLAMMKSMGLDEEALALFEQSSKEQEQRVIQTLMNSTKLGFSDVMDDPEVQEAVQQATMSGVLGPTGPLGGSKPVGEIPGMQLQMPKTQLGAR